MARWDRAWAWTPILPNLDHLPPHSIAECGVRNEECKNHQETKSEVLPFERHVFNSCFHHAVCVGRTSRKKHLPSGEGD